MRFTAVGAVAVAAIAAPASAQFSPVTFGPPVLLTTFAQCGGYEPTVVVDSFNNVVVTAHKQNHCLAAAPDPQGTLPARGMSWLWTSHDGVHFTDMPGLTAAGVDRLDVGDEGDLSVDDAGNIYFVDTKVADTSFTSWHATGNGAVTETSHLPAIGTAEASDDRPWIDSHGNGKLIYLGNEGDTQTYPLGTNGNGCGPGRFTVYPSADGGVTWDHQGCTLPGSGWCRPAADHSANSPYFYVICTDDGSPNGKLNVYASNDNGHSWVEHPIGTYAKTGDQGWPSAAVDSQGNVYAQYGEPDKITMYRSTDHGATWTPNVVASNKDGAYQFSYNWLAVAPDGSIGTAYYSTPAPGSNATWYIYAGTAPSWGGNFTMANLAPDDPVADQGVTPWGDFFTIAFGRDNKLSVVWTKNDVIGGDTSGTTSGLNSNIYYAVESGSLGGPNPQLPESPATVLLAVFGLAVTGGAMAWRRRRLTA